MSRLERFLSAFERRNLPNTGLALSVLMMSVPLGLVAGPFFWWVAGPVASAAVLIKAGIASAASLGITCGLATLACAAVELPARARGRAVQQRVNKMGQTVEGTGNDLNRLARMEQHIAYLATVAENGTDPKAATALKAAFAEAAPLRARVRVVAPAFESPVEIYTFARTVLRDETVSVTRQVPVTVAVANPV